MNECETTEDSHKKRTYSTVPYLVVIELNLLVVIELNLLFRYYSR